METTIQINNNDEINVLRIKLEVVEKELQLAISRAEKAENELEQLKNLYINSSHVGSAKSHSSNDTESAVICSHCGHSFHLQSPSSATTATAVTCLPPPPPPPMPNFKPNPVNFNQYGTSLKDGITAFTLNNQREMDDNFSICSNPDGKKSATGRSYILIRWNVNWVWKSCCCYIFRYTQTLDCVHARSSTHNNFGK